MRRLTVFLVVIFAVAACQAGPQGAPSVIYVNVTPAPAPSRAIVPTANAGSEAPPISGPPDAATTPGPPSPEPTATASFASAGVAPSELDVRCDGTRTNIASPLVRTQADGVHIHAVNASGRPLDARIEDASGSLSGFGAGFSMPVGAGTAVYTFGAGSYHLTCGGSGSTFVVVDPDRFYTPAELRCATQTSGSMDYGAGARGPRGSVADVARAELRGLAPGDAVERAGYPQAAGDRLVRVVRRSQVVAVLQYSDDGHGGWLIGGIQACSGSGITITAPTG